MIEVYTDGACKGNPGPGGWGVVIIDSNSEKYLKGFHPETTNNIMELKAVIEALKQINLKTKIRIYTDSKYVKLGITEWIFNWKKNGWKTSSKKDVKNKNFWIELDHLVGQNEIVWEWVKGHSGNKYNDKVDELANQAISENL
ncbi:MAG: ribonuclease HI [Candidatus Marinimicrobia bacterium]|nr:ribonuclease HI [Candidatus Neomarinimicrobiota bacterium]|tara:strand:+ start:746 stop:1174 length:429 start_codon:yes stop_codon:yes gene_type:complete